MEREPRFKIGEEVEILSGTIERGEIVTVEIRIKKNSTTIRYEVAIPTSRGNRYRYVREEDTVRA